MSSEGRLHSPTKAPISTSSRKERNVSRVTVVPVVGEGSQPAGSSSFRRLQLGRLDSPLQPSEQPKPRGLSGTSYTIVPVVALCTDLTQLSGPVVSSGVPNLTLGACGLGSWLGHCLPARPSVDLGGPIAQCFRARHHYCPQGAMAQMPSTNLASFSM